jgi:hypothetical protein
VKAAPLVVGCHAELAGETDHTLTIVDPASPEVDYFKLSRLPGRHRVIQGTLPRGSFFEGQFRDMAVGENHRNIQPFA